MAITASGYSHSIGVESLWLPEEDKRPANLMGIKPWIIRNLLAKKNCLMKRSYYMGNEKVFIKLFGKKQMKLTLSDKGCCILWITDDAVAKAKLLIY